jgi:hypothetical protein
MLEEQASKISPRNELRQLIQPENLVGACYRMTYDTAHVMVNDMEKAKVRGVPHNCFLVAASFNPENFPQSSLDERRVILLRVTGSAKLPQDDDLIEAKIESLQERKSPQDENELDSITEGKMQFHGLECRILGTFYRRDQRLQLGSDIESFSSATRLDVYCPRGEALKKIVNFVDPIKQEAADEAAEEMGLGDSLSPFKVGTVRYTSTDHMHREEDEPKVPVKIQPADFLGRRTAVLGMTRTGKSNMIKKLVSEVKRVSDDSGTNIGQIIYDVNGEYANVNEQDEGAIADIYPAEAVVRYSTRPPEGFEDLRTNFYEQLNEGHSIIRQELEKKGEINSNSSGYKNAFASLSFDEPPSENYSERYRWERRVAAYQAVLYRAGFEPPGDHTVQFTVSENVRDRVSAHLRGDTPNDPSDGLSLEETVDWFRALRIANNEEELESTSGNAWVDPGLDTLIRVLTGPHRNVGRWETGYRMLLGIDEYHSPQRSDSVTREIYDHLEDGKVVILDLSLARPSLREEMGEDVAREIFYNSMEAFVNGKIPPNIVVYTEESHNLIGDDLDLDETWPRLAKEGAKYNVAMVYATQEVSSVHQNILANTENWFITHLNNENEIKELSKFYDFDDFSKSLLRAQDVGFARVKTLSGPFVIPTQIDEFDPERERQRVQDMMETASSNGQSDDDDFPLEDMRGAEE